MNWLNEKIHPAPDWFYTLYCTVAYQFLCIYTCSISPFSLSFTIVTKYIFGLSLKTCNSLYHISFVHILSLLMPANSFHGDSEVLGRSVTADVGRNKHTDSNKGKNEKARKGVHSIKLAYDSNYATCSFIFCGKINHFCRCFTCLPIMSKLLENVFVGCFTHVSNEGLFCV